jgi:hypothetical protein
VEEFAPATGGGSRGGRRGHGDALLRFIYTDEAGTSAKEPIVVMVGLVVDADAQQRPAERCLQQLHATVPEQFRDGFISHATTIWSDKKKKYRPVWRPGERFEFLCRMMMIPKATKMGIAWAAAHKQGVDDLIPLPGCTRDQTLHTGAFGYCIANADRYIRLFYPNEVSAVIAEDLPEMRAPLSQRFQFLRTHRHIISADQVSNCYAFGIAPTMMTPALHTEYTISQVVNDVHFVGKNGASLLQVADACAFGMRRFFTGLSQGKEFMQAMIGSGGFLPSPPPPGLIHNGMLFDVGPPLA